MLIQVRVQVELTLGGGRLVTARILPTVLAIFSCLLCVLSLLTGGRPREHWLRQCLDRRILLPLTLYWSLRDVRSLRHCEAGLPILATSEDLLLPSLLVELLLDCFGLFHQVLLHACRALADLEVLHLVFLDT